MRDEIVIEGKRYKRVDRKARTGDRILIVNAEDTYGKYSDGDTFIVDDFNEIGVEVAEAGSDEAGNREGFIADEEYHVLEPAESPKTNVDMLVSLSQEVVALNKELAKLKKELADLRAGSANKEDVEKFAETAEEASLKAGQALTTSAQFAKQLERNIDDISMLDERTQPLVDEGVSAFATELAEMIERKINESYRRGRI